MVFDLTGSSDVIDIELVEDDPPASLAPPAIPRELPPVDCAASRRSLTELEFEQQQIAQRYDEVAARLDRDIEAEGKAPASRRAQARRKREFTERELEKWQQEADRVMPEIARLRMVLSVASCQ